jgi:hypothetical protein
LRRKPSVKFWLLIPNQNQVLRIAMLKTILRRKKKRNNNNKKPQQKPNHRLQKLGDYQPGTASRKPHNYSFFCQSSKRCE